ncbi:MAG: CocE/NonD family hydrolase [Acidimicrobiaceae bacterium]|nr:CocE/NonD family hydrolase [Acidimicrobiaceae bacterium]
MSTNAVIHDAHVRVPMRDGVRLAADVWRPATDQPLPVLVSRTPYGREMLTDLSEPERLATAGFAVVLQDCRGRFSSEGEWGYVRCEVADGYDTVEWAAAQPWSNGRVGMFGASYMGYTQWLAAVAGPPHLEVMAPECCAADYWVASFDSCGTFRLALRFGWTASVIAAMAPEWGIDDPRLDKLRQTFLDSRAAALRGDLVAVRDLQEAAKVLLDEVYRTRPIEGIDLWHGRATWLDEIFEHEARDDANWRSINPSSHYGDLDVPAVHVGGWYDIHLEGILANYAGMRRQAPTERARQAQRLIVGPWAHWTPMLPVVGEVNFGPEGVLDTTAMRLAWFGHFLQDGPEPSMAPVRIFVMGANAWRDEQEWPLARTRFTPWYLGAGGTLGPSAPGSDEEPDAFTYDPRDPVPTVGGKLLGMGELAGPREQAAVGERPDVLVYTSEVLSEALELTGPVRAEVWLATDAPDTDVTAVLLDVHPDGSAWNLCEGAVRARHSGVAVPMLPGAVYRFAVDLVATSLVLPAGHRLRLHLSSSSFPEWEPNPNTGRPIGADGEADLRSANQQVFHDVRHPSHVVLPVIPS